MILSGGLHPYCGWDLVVLHPHHHLLLHGQPGGLPHGGDPRAADRVGGGPRQPERDLVRGSRRRLHLQVLPEVGQRRLPAAQSVHVRF